MKIMPTSLKLILICIISAPSLLSQAQTQAQIDKLKNDNALLKNQIKNLQQDTTYLKQTINTCDLLKHSNEIVVKNNNPNYTFEYLECTGDRNMQTVTITFMISQNLVHQNFTFSDKYNILKSYDNLGNTFAFKSTTFPIKEDMNGDNVQIPTGVRIKGSLVFSNVLPSTEQITSMLFYFFTTNLDGGFYDYTKPYSVEFKNMPIKWSVK